jgi:m7GpppX diphosphatase
VEIIYKRTGIDKHKVRMYVHYFPTYFHFHVHFAHLDCEGKTVQFEKAHDFNGVIMNIEMQGDYYQKADLLLELDIDNPLYEIYKKMDE